MGTQNIQTTRLCLRDVEKTVIICKTLDLKVYNKSDEDLDATLDQIITEMITMRVQVVRDATKEALKKQLLLGALSFANNYSF